MNVLSLFDGMSCGQIALERAGIAVDNYFASEIDKYAMKVTKANYPNTKHVGSVLDVKGDDLPEIDLLIGGSPCQGFSFAGKQLNFDDPRSALFFEFVRLLEETKPKYFLLENVKMKKEHQDIISEHLGVEPICINSSLVSAQNRVRYYWTNISVQQPEDTGKLLSDVTGVQDIPLDIEGLLLSRTIKTKQKFTDESSTLRRMLSNLASPSQKSKCLTATMYKGMAANGMTNIFDGDIVRQLTPIECERLQTVDDGYTDHVSNTQRYKMLGNGWTVEVISHILKNLM